MQAKLKEENIMNIFYYVKPMYEKEQFQTTNELSETVLSLPIHPYLSEQEIDQVFTVLRKI